MKAKFRVYEDPATGNKFVLFAPGHVIVPDKHGWDSVADVIMESMIWSMTMGLNIPKDYKAAWIEAEMVNDHVDLVHVKTTITSRHLQHGACTVFIVGGPLFDQAQNPTIKESTGTDENPAPLTTP